MLLTGIEALAWYGLRNKDNLHAILKVTSFNSLPFVCLYPQTNLPIFKLKESSVRRRYSDFEWLRAELERESKVVVPPLPGKALFRQLPFRGDDGIYDDSFVEERRQSLEQFLNKVAGHPLAQNERCLHMFLQDESLDKSYTPSKIRQAWEKRWLCSAQPDCPKLSSLLQVSLRQ